jgi:hypothetical protein
MAFDHDRVEYGCAAGTRIKVLEDMRHWMENPVDTQICYLTGIARIGKTAIANTVANIASDVNCLGATFFVSRLSRFSGDYENVISTLAFQLAMVPGLRSHLIAVLDANPDVAKASIAVQAQKLIFEVLQTMVSKPPSYFLIVLDALDECKQDEDGVHGGNMIFILLNGLLELPFVKVLVTSRHNPSITAMFTDGPFQSATRTLNLDDEDDTL